jgi:rhodanese-related sulfurtransferase
LEKAKEWIAAGDIALDVRGVEQFKFRHIPVAVLLPVEALRVAIPAWRAAVKEKQTVVYCGDGVAHGPEATRLRVQAGFGHAANLAVGVEGWEKAGLALARG